MHLLCSRVSKVGHNNASAEEVSVNESRRRSGGARVVRVVDGLVRVRVRMLRVGELLVRRKISLGSLILSTLLLVINHRLVLVAVIKALLDLLDLDGRDGVGRHFRAHVDRVDAARLHPKLAHRVRARIRVEEEEAGYDD